MLYNAYSGIVQNTEYIRFGRGENVLVMLPGLGDGLRSMKGTALAVALMYRMFARDYTVYVFSRRLDLPAGHTTRDMAKDLAEAMDALAIPKADVFGVSMGGMIAQHLAIDYPEKVGKLVLAVTCSKPNAILEESLSEWMALARREDHTAFMASNLERIYSEKYCRQNRWMVPILGKLTKPSSYDRFLILAEACRNHCAPVEQIKAPTFVIGGEKDKALGGEASRELGAVIPNARLHMYPQWGHGLYEEAKDFNDLVLAFLKK